MKRAMTRFCVFLVIGVIFASVMLPVSRTPWAEGVRVWVAEARASKAKAGKQPGAAPEKPGKAVTGVPQEKPKGPPPAKKPNFSAAGFSQIGQHLAWIVVPFLVTLLILAVLPKKKKPKAGGEPHAA